MATLDDGTCAVVNDTEPPASLLDRALKLSAQTFRQEPPPREYVLSVAATGAGVLARGKVGLFAARGGTGKSMGLIQLSLAVALGGDWFSWHATKGRVLMLAAEEDEGEMRRRLYHAARVAGIVDDKSIATIARNVTVLPLAGCGCAMTTAVDPLAFTLPETELPGLIRNTLTEAVAEGRPYTLVVLDPLSRFAGADVEKDNPAATRFVQVMESFTAPDLGSPTVLISHHFRKSAAGSSNDAETADPIRGASGLVDGVRWAATLEAKRKRKGAPDLLTLRVVKTNYAAAPDPVTLCRPADWHGCLRLSTEDEEFAYTDAPTADKRDELTTRVLAALTERPQSSTELATSLGARKDLIVSVCRERSDMGQIRRTKGERSPWEIVPGSFP